MGLLDARGGPDRISGEEGPVERTHGSRADFSFRKIVSRWAAYICSPPGWCGKQAAVYFFSPHSQLAPVRAPVSEKVYESTGHCSLLFPFTVTLRRFHDACINQRIDSLPCPALLLNVSGAASPRQLTPRTRIPLTTTIGLRRLELRLDYVRRVGELRGSKSGMWLSAGGIEVSEDG
jgi:hypothetical protein